jgi:hypothetical protein
MKHLLIAALLAVLCAPAWAINKCTGQDGKVAYQDAPCAGKGEQLTVRPASGGAAPALKATSGAGPGTEARRIEAQVTQSQRERRRRDLEQLFIPQARAVIEKHRASCAEQQTRLEASKYVYKQNLYGKTHAAQAASEMAAAAATCDTKDRELKENLDALRKECETLGCPKD